MSLVLALGFVVLAGCGKQESQVAEQQTMPAQKPAETVTPPAPAPSGIPTVAGDTVTTASGLKYIDITVGTGATPAQGQSIHAKYAGWLTNGTPFDSGEYEFPLGGGRVIRGWEEAFSTMKVGGRRLLIIPPDLAYGANGRPPVIPPNSTLVFDVELQHLH